MITNGIRCRYNGWTTRVLFLLKSTWPWGLVKFPPNLGGIFHLISQSPWLASSPTNSWVACDHCLPIQEMCIILNWDVISMKNIVLWESLILNRTVVDSECRFGNLCSGHSRSHSTYKLSKYQWLSTPVNSRTTQTRMIIIHLLMVQTFKPFKVLLDIWFHCSRSPIIGAHDREGGGWEALPVVFKL